MLLSIDLLNHVLLYALKATCVLVVVHWLVDQSRALSADVARLVLAAAAIAAVAAPLLALSLPRLPLPVVPPFLAHWLNIPLVELERGVLHYNLLALVALTLYLIVATWLLCHLVIGIAQVAGLSRRARPVPGTVQSTSVNISKRMALSRLPQVKMSHEVVSPQVWGHWRPVVLLPAASVAWSEDRLRRVLIHELAHIKRSDWLMKLALHVASALVWLIPQLWLTARRSAWYAELACDDWVVRLEGVRAEYADDLLELSLQADARSLGSVSLTESRQVYARIRAVLDGSRNRLPASTRERFGYLLLTCLLLLPLAPIQAVVHHSPEYAGLPRQQVRLVIGLDPQPGATDSAAEPGFSPEAFAHLREKPALPPAVEEVLTFASPPHAAHAVAFADKVPELTITVDPGIAMRGPARLVAAMPRYPRRALCGGIEGSVTVEFDVGLEGQVIAPRVTQSEPRHLFDQAAINAVAKFRFRPQSVNGQPIITKNVTETFTFQLIDGATDNHPKPKQQSEVP
jgi:TonB family protein